MSSELRLKKLRGSGGYIMAQVSDEEQTKGNLGGPDLFLAPVGRIDADRISKHFCNTCEKEFEVSPKIDYERPNETVAENLVLVERGQYVCEICCSVIAEYREFSKLDSTQEAGLAVPKEDARPQPQQESVQETPDTTDGVTHTSGATQPQQESVSETQVQEKSVQETPAAPETKSDTSSSISSIEGMTVFDSDARRVGVAKHLGVDSNRTLMLIITADGDNQIAMPWSDVETIGDVILLGDTQPDGDADEAKPGKCASCGFANKADAKFCEECGTKL